MPFAYYSRLSAAQQRIYRTSDAIESIPLPPALSVGTDVCAIRAALAADDPRAVQRACQRVADALTAGCHVPPLRIRVLAQRPSDDYGELHGLYEPAEGAGQATISVWMRTAQKKQVVKFRTFLRTVVHELCHHFDYELYGFAETFHTQGFYTRESTLMRELLGEKPKA
jgi:hypothetical protein